jgi:hypothetical protein
MDGAKRAADLTQRLLAFSRQQPLEPKPLTINKMVSGMRELLDRTFGETISIESVLAAGLWRVTEAGPTGGPRLRPAKLDHHPGNRAFRRQHARIHAR